MKLTASFRAQYRVTVAVVERLINFSVMCPIATSLSRVTLPRLMSFLKGYFSLTFGIFHETEEPMGF